MCREHRSPASSTARTGRAVAEVEEVEEVQEVEARAATDDLAVAGAAATAVPVEMAAAATGRVTRWTSKLVVAGTGVEAVPGMG